MKQENAEIVAVGTELLLGQIPNTNAQWLSKAMASIGINVRHHSVVGDNLRRVEEQFRIAGERADIIIVTGGLGPTEDDLTREAFQQLTGIPIIEHKSSMEKIEAYFAEKQETMTSNNRKQARVFTGADVMTNNTGMAPGMIVTHNDKTWVFLPGVPREMKRMMTDRVIPRLQQVIGRDTVIKSTMLRFTGIGESKVEDKLLDLIQQQTNPTIAPLAQDQGIAIRLTAKAEFDQEADRLIKQSRAAVMERVGEFFHGTDDQTLEESVYSLLKQQGYTLGAAESLTGGMFTERLTAIPGASDVCTGAIVCYGTQVKEQVLNVSSELIRQHGTISEACASSMAENVRSRLDSDIGISFTGAAGPDSSERQPAGTVFIGVYDKSGKQTVEKYTFQGDRQTVRERAVLKGYELLFNLLK
ncbi:competence/damage-inducible protein A [Lentibacillus kimchii]